MPPGVKGADDVSGTRGLLEATMNTRKHVEEAGTPGHGIAQKNQGPTVGFFNEPLGEDK